MKGESPPTPVGLSEEVFRHVTYVGMHKPNWGKHSGANGLMHVTPSRAILLDRTTPSWASFFLWPVAKRIKAGKNFWYGPETMRLEARVAGDWMKRKNHIYHFLSGENEYLLSGHLKRFRANLIVCTFHLPVFRFSDIILRLDDLERLDGAVVMSSNLVDFTRDLLGHERVWFVPHGVVSDFWVPPPERDFAAGGNFTVLFVGSHLRDFETFRDVVKTLRESSCPISFEAVLSRQDMVKAKGLEGITIHTSIDDTDLLALYQKSDLMICPLVDCNASNSILEALSCGLPQVVTDIGGVRDYVNDDCAVLTPCRDPAAMADEVLALLQSAGRREAMSKAARRRARELDWRQVALMMEEVYRRVLGASP
jgi:glycosyltransferase involved in cell wall biosynthesis